MPRYSQPHRLCLSNRVVLLVRRVATILLPLAMLAACSLPGAAPSAANSPDTAASTRTAISQSPLASETVYWSQGTLLYALRASDGQLRWKVGDQSVSLPNGDGTLTGGPGAPTVADGTLYAIVALDYPTVYALAAADGTTRWHTALPGCVNAPMSEDPPLLADGLLYVAASGHNCAANASGWVYALRPSDGTVAWRTSFERVVGLTVILTGGALLVTSSTYPDPDEQDFLTALRPTDGAHLWRVRLDHSLGSVAAADGIVVDTGYFSGTAFEARRASDGQRLWSTPINRYNLAPPVIANGLVYVSGQDGYLYALRLQDGTVQWRFPWGASSTATGVFTPSVPTVVDNTIYWGAGPLLYALDARTGALRHTYHPFPDEEGSAPGQYIFRYSPPAVASGALFVAAHVSPACKLLNCRGGGPITLYAFDVATSAELWHHTELLLGITFLPVVVGPYGP